MVLLENKRHKTHQKHKTWTAQSADGHKFWVMNKKKQSWNSAFCVSHQSAVCVLIKTAK